MYDVLILGSGVIGVSSAWYLAAAGLKVAVLERQQTPALETSFANAGQISPGYAAPWAAPGIPAKALRWLWQRHAPLAMSHTSINQWHWLYRLWRECQPHRYTRNKARMVALAEYSRDCLDQLRTHLALGYEGRCQGTLQIFRTSAQVAQAARDIAVLAKAGVPYQVLDREGCITYEPALAASAMRLQGGLRLPHDETGDCYLFTTNLAKHAQHHGVDFFFNQSVTGLQTRNGQISGVNTTTQTLQAHHYVLALGSFTPALLKPLGLAIPVYPVKGYSLTLPIIDATQAPQSTLLDESYKVAITRFDHRIRVGGMAELAEFDLRLHPRRRQTLMRVVQDWFPHGGDLTQASFWCGLRPMTPDGTPLISATPWQNLWLNTGHGTLGWTMACGSAAVLRDLILGYPPAISAADLALTRYTTVAQ